MDTPDPEVRAIVRNLYECADAILMRQVDHLITTRRVYIGANFLYLAHKAFYFGMVGALVKVLETHNSRAGSFLWLYNKNKDHLDEFARSRNYDLTSLWSLAERARDIRNKMLFHIDKEGLVSPKEVWKEANISGFDVGRALETVWHCLQHLYRLKTGGYFARIPALEREPTEEILDHIVGVIERTDVSLETLSPTNLSADLR
jgi:hypothetical protein